MITVKFRTSQRDLLLMPLVLLVMLGSGVNVSAAPVETSQQQQISRSLPFGLTMRLPSAQWLNERLGAPGSQSIQIVPTTSKTSLKLDLFKCPQQTAACFVGSVTARKSLEAKELAQYQAAATPVTLAKNLRGYLLTTETPAGNESSSLMWQQDEQYYTVTLPATAPRQQVVFLAAAIARSLPIHSLAQAPVPTAPENLRSPLQTRAPILTTAEQLRQGEVLVNLRYRQSFPQGSAADTGLTGQPTLGATWGVTDNLELTLDAQTVDNSGPGRQGRFDVKRINIDNTSSNFFQEITLQGKQRIWENKSGTQALSGVVAASVGIQGRPYRFTEPNGAIAASGRNGGVAISLELPYTIAPSDRLQLTLSPKIAFFPDSNALYFTRPPASNANFGTAFGLAGGVTYQLLPRLLLWGDAFIPLTGNNSINRATASPARTISYNAGLRYLVNPRLAADLFVSNTLGNTGAMSILGDRAYTSLGLGVTFLPGVSSANRRYAQSFGQTVQPPPSTVAGFGFLDGGTVANQQLLLNLQGGSQGLLGAVRYGLLDDLEVGVFLDNVPGIIDESQLGFSGKIRFLNQADGAPFTLSGVATLARSNNVLINLISNNRNEFEQRGLEKGGFAFSNEKAGELFIITLSAPMHYQFRGGSAVWLTPTLGFIQRNGLQIAGLNLGGSVPLGKDVDAIAEAGINFTSDGNAFIGNNLENAIPWTVGLRWQPSALFGISENSPQIEAYLTNRVGSSPFETLRVRADNDLAVGVGLLLPIQF